MKTNVLCQSISLYQFRSASLKKTMGQGQAISSVSTKSFSSFYSTVFLILQHYLFQILTVQSFQIKKVTVIFVVGRSLPEGDLLEKFFRFIYIYFLIFFISMYIVFHHTVCTYLPLFQVLPESGHQTIVEICCNTTQAFLKTLTYAIIFM